MKKIEAFNYNEFLFRQIAREDIEDIRKWRNDESTRTQFLFNKELTIVDQQRWYERYLEQENDIMFMVENVQTNAKIGVVAIYGIDYQNKRAEFGRLMVGNKEYRGRGIGKDFVRAMIQYAFNQLWLNELFLEVFEDNLPAKKSYEACGFTCNGSSRLINNRVLIEMSIKK